MKVASRILGIGLVVVAIGALATVRVATGTMAANLTFAQVGTLPIQADTIEMEDGIAYVAAGKTLTMFDVKNPAAPKKLSAYSFPEEIWAFRVQGHTAYIGGNFFGLGILDVSNPATPVLRGSFKTPGQAKVGAVFGNRALVIDHMEGVVEVDITNPAKPTSPGSFFLDGYARDVVTSGSLAFAVDSPTGFYVFDLAKPGPLEPIASLQVGTGLRGIDVTTGDGPLLAVAVGGGSLQIYDVAKPAAPVKLPPYRTPGGAQRVSLKGRLAYVADGGAGVTVIDLQTPTAPVVVGSHKTATAARDVAVADSTVLVAVANADVILLRENR